MTKSVEGVIMPQRAFEPSIPSGVRIFFILNFVQDGGNVKGSS